jgi:plastocyanin
MSGQDWSITIVALDSGGAAFQPDLMGANPGDPLKAGNADLISWNNRTANTHQPWAADANYQPLPENQIVKGNPGNYLSDPIPPWTPSTPAYLTTAAATPTTIYYVCKYHPTEHGQIIVTA